MSHTIGDTSASPCRSAQDSNVSRPGVLRPAVVVGQPHPVGAECQRMQHAQRESACAAQVSARSEVGRRHRLARHQVAHPLVEVVVDDDEVVDHARLGAQHVQDLASSSGGGG